VDELERLVEAEEAMKLRRIALLVPAGCTWIVSASR